MTVTLMQSAVGLGCLVALLVVFYGPWQWLCTDIARHIVFEKRDTIFNLAAAGHLSFDSREYVTIRSALQASIRFAHDLTLPHFLVLGIALWLRGELRGKDTICAAIGQIADPAVRAQVRGLLDQAYRALLLMVLAKSLLAWLLLPLLMVTAAALFTCRDMAWRVERQAGQVIQVEADAVPSLEIPATA